LNKTLQERVELLESVVAALIKKDSTQYNELKERHEIIMDFEKRIKEIPEIVNYMENYC